MFSEQIGQAIFLRVISLTVIPAPHAPQVTFLSGAGIAGNGRGGKLPDAGSGNGGNLPNSGNGNAPGAGGIGNGGKSPRIGNALSSIVPGGGIGGRFLVISSNLSFASLSPFLFILRSNLFEAIPASTFASNSEDKSGASDSNSSSNTTFG